MLFLESVSVSCDLSSEIRKRKSQFDSSPELTNSGSSVCFVSQLQFPLYCRAPSQSGCSVGRPRPIGPAYGASHERNCPGRPTLHRDHRLSSSTKRNRRRVYFDFQLSTFPHVFTRAVLRLTDGASWLYSPHTLLETARVPVGCTRAISSVG